MTPHLDSLRLLERLGWQSCGAGYFEHGDHPLQQFDTQTALEMAREQFRKECAKDGDR